MEDLVATLFEFKEVALLIAGGLFMPAIAVTLMKLLALPVVVNLVDGALFLWGKACSVFLTQRIPKYGRRLEDFMQRWLDDRLKAFYRGLDADDK